MPFSKMQMPNIGIPSVIPGGLQKRLLKFLFKRSLGRFIKSGLDLHNLDVQLPSGFISLSNLQLDAQVFDQYLAPHHLRLESGNVSRITITIPWRSLWDGNVIVAISGINLVFVPSNGDVESKSVYEDLVMSTTHLAEDFMKEPPPVPSAMGPDDEIAWKHSSADGDNPFVKVIEDLITRIKFTVKDVSAVLKSRESRYQLTFNIPEVEIQDASDDQTMRKQLCCPFMSLSDADGTFWAHTGESTGLTICLDIDRHVDQAETEVVCDYLQVFVTPEGVTLFDKVMNSLSSGSTSSSHSHSPHQGYFGSHDPPTSPTRRSANLRRSGASRTGSAPWGVPSEMSTKMTDTMYASAMSYNAPSTASFYSASGGKSMATSTFSTHSQQHSIPALKTTFLLRHLSIYASLEPQISANPFTIPAHPRNYLPKYDLHLNLTSLFACSKRAGRWELTASSLALSERIPATQGMTRPGKQQIIFFDAELPDSDFKLTADGRLWVSSEAPAPLTHPEMDASFTASKSPTTASPYDIPSSAAEPALKISFSGDGLSISMLPFHLRISPAVIERLQIFATAITRASEVQKRQQMGTNDPHTLSHMAGSPLSHISDPLEFLMEDLGSGSSPSPRECSHRSRELMHVIIECPLARLWVEDSVIVDLRQLHVHASPKGSLSGHCKDIALFLRRPDTSAILHATPGMAECILKVSGKGEDRPGFEFKNDSVFGGNWALEMPTNPSPGIRLELPYIWLRATQESISALKSINIRTSEPPPKTLRSGHSETHAQVFMINTKEVRATANCSTNTSILPSRAHDYDLSLSYFHIRGFSQNSSFSMYLSTSLLMFSESGVPIFHPTVAAARIGESPMATVVYRKERSKESVTELLFQKTEWNLRPCRSAILAMWKDIATLFKDPVSERATDLSNSGDLRPDPIQTTARPRRTSSSRREQGPEFLMDFVDCHIRLGKSESRAELLLVLDRLEVSLSNQIWEFDVRKVKGFLVEDTRRLESAMARHSGREARLNAHLSIDAFLRRTGYLKVFTATGVKVHVIPEGMNAINGAGMEVRVSNEAMSVEICSDSLETLAEASQCISDMRNSIKAPVTVTVTNSPPEDLPYEFDLTQSIDEDTFKIRSTVDESHISASSIPPMAQMAAPLDSDSAPDFFDVPALEMDANRRPSHRHSSTAGSGGLSPATKRDATFLLEEENDLGIFDNFFVVPKKEELSSDSVAVAAPFDFRFRLEGCNITVRLFEGLDWVHEDLKSAGPNTRAASTLRSPDDTRSGESADTQDYFEVPEYGVPEKLSGPRTKNSVQVVASGIRGVFTTWQDSKKKQNAHGPGVKKSMNPTLTTNTFVASIVSQLSLDVQDLEVIDDVSSSTWKKFATRYRDVSADVAARPMLSLELSGVRVSPEHTEYRMNVSMVPLRFNIDQDALVVLLSFVPSEPSSEQDIFFQHVVIDPILLRIDYKPKHLNYKQLRHGNFLELLNFFSLEGAMMTLRQVKVSGVEGFGRLGKEIVSRWIPSVKPGNVVEGVGPVRNLKNIGKGVVDLVLVPIDQYMKHGRIVTGLQRGAQTFAWTAVEETLDLTARLAVGTHVLLEHADEILNTGNAVSFGSGGPASPSSSRQDVTTSHESLSDEPSTSAAAASKYSAQPGSLKEGISEAWKVLGRTIVAMPTEVSDGRQVIKAVPVAVLRPVMGATEAVSKALLGMRNSVNPKRKLDIEDKYKRRNS